MLQLITSIELITIIPLTGVILLPALSYFSKGKVFEYIALIYSFLTLLLSIYILNLYGSQTDDIFNTSIHLQLLEEKYFIFKNLSYWMTLDGISLLFILLTTFICTLSTLCIIKETKPVLNTGSLKEGPKKNLRAYLILVLFLEWILIMAFLSADLLWFYIWYESVLIPIYIIVNVWGHNKRRSKAAMYLFFFAFFGSLSLLLGILIVYWTVGNTSWYSAYIYNFSIETQKVLWVLFFLGFAIKVPLWPFHIWLPEAHVEAPTVGSIILAALLLKLGGFGFIRFVLPLFPEACVYFSPLAITLCVVGIVYSSLTTVRQIDLKRIIAYSSVAHMSYAMLGIFSLNYYGILGGVLLMLGHGLVSTALFFLAGVIYDKYGTRIIKYYGGLNQTMPLFSLFFFFFVIANMGLPGLGIFPGELFASIGIFSANNFAAIICALSSVFTVAYMILLFNRVVFGTLKMQYIDKYKDLDIREFIILLVLSYLTLLFGLCPQFFIVMVEHSIIKISRLYDVRPK